MSKRSEIIDPSEYRKGVTGLMYTELLGWIDLGHALGGDITRTLSKFRQGEMSRKPYYLVQYEQIMRAGKFATGRYIGWNIKRGRSQHEIHSILLAMVMRTAVLFENWQAQPWFSWYTDSGFSGEDLVSDLLGFYSVVRPMNYINMIQPVSKEAALRRWDHYGPIGNFKNKGFKPLLFPDPAIENVPLTPYKANLPGFMTAITPFTDFRSGIVRIIDKASILNEYRGFRIP
ncbi:hypothetical protein [Erwinia psidii]|uniref:DUF4056 domain-containing protein n=1 Tax=Erwinia psidii TaxID=69224 RepID=A0A3N6SH57_9GAMM|nr:hypothetical protein [Erwinia psidii]MCX8959441.1 hypothetical protein [Erwinia psidii]MCX8962747.1 hypothetical protein [Erwinia psidii]MCX8964293.1 hypothetical protein [Erwinia psidii]RQM36876.1 hypothetical protein EB241_18085 [Erwinia psidii]